MFAIKKSSFIPPLGTLKIIFNFLLERLFYLRRIYDKAYKRIKRKNFFVAKVKKPVLTGFFIRKI